MDTKFKTIIEPFRIKVVEPLPMLTPAERGFAFVKVHYLISLSATRCGSISGEYRIKRSPC